ncbi:hypothetical protein WICPIJ_008295 [Wickerhamomyces pijperi]|uniref:Uncharacterized protein n=1 Tax=Wickerhamomyces pijperi TaxID=599730 RepID=A0A9P8Q030_WICPI|nr:hypothetical protein WICPIJ_008295 [Wickerhamomyces pijperi]
MTLILFLGLKINNLSNRSNASGFVPSGNKVSNGVFLLNGKDLIYSLALLDLMLGFPLNISAKMHPTDQTSIAVVYSWNVSMISGARYHLVATYSVMKPKLFSVEAMDLARPKSHTFKSQLEFKSKLEGFKSL